MDALGLQFIWLNFPKISSTVGNWAYAAGKYAEMLAAEERRRRERGEIGETPREVRVRILESIEARLTQRDDDNLFLALAV